MPHDIRLDRVYTARNAGELTAEYDRIAEGYDAALTEDHDWRMPEIMASLVAWLLPRDARILDAACGTGLVGEHLKRFGFTELHGLDLSAGMLAVAERKHVYRNLIAAALGGPLPYRTGEFDAFTVAGAFTPQHAPASSLQELTRVTRPGGYAIFSLRADLAQPEFAAEIAALASAGRWSLVHRGAEFQSLPRAEPQVRNRLSIYQLA
jgi:predicted TPR repeat methyltransferase